MAVNLIPENTEFQVNTRTYSYQSGSEVTKTDEGFVVTWYTKNSDYTYDLFAQRFDINRKPIGEEISILIEQDINESFGYSLTVLKDSSFLIANSDYPSGEIFIKNIDKDGSTILSSNKISGQNSGERAVDASVQIMSNGDVIVSYALLSDTNSSYVQKFNSELIKTGDLVVIDSERSPQIYTLDNGNYLVGVDQFDATTQKNNYLMQMYNADNTTIGEAIIITNIEGSYSITPEDTITSLSDGGFIATYYRNDGEGVNYDFNIYAQQFDATGVATNNEFLVNTHTINDQINPSIDTLANDSYLITWKSKDQDGDGFGVYGQIFDKTGNKTGVEFQVNTETSGHQGTESIDILNDGFVISWTSSISSGKGEIYAQRFDLQGNKIGTTENSISVNNPPEVKTALTIDSSSVGDTYPVINPNDYFSDPDGDTLTFEYLVVKGNDQSSYSYTSEEWSALSVVPLEASDAGQWEVTIIASDSIDQTSQSAVWNIQAAQSPIVDNGNFLITDNTTQYEEIHSTTLKDGISVVAWIDKNYQINYQCYDINRNEVGDTKILGKGFEQDITALSDGGFVISYTNTTQENDILQVAKFNADGTKVLETVDVITNSTHVFEQSSAIGLYDGGYLVAWTSFLKDESDSEVMAQRFDASNEKVGESFMINTTTIDTQKQPGMIVLKDDSSVAVWETPNNTINAQLFDKDSVKVGNEILITVDGEYRNEPAITLLNDGSYLITSETMDGDIYGQLFDQNHALIGNEFKINTAPGGEESSDITAFGTDGFVATWSQMGVQSMAQVYQQNNAIGDPIIVSEPIENGSDISVGVTTVSALNDGGFLVSWQTNESSYDPSTGNTSSSSIFGQRFDAQSQKVGVTNETILIAPEAVDDTTILYVNSQDNTIAVLDNDKDDDGQFVTVELPTFMEYENLIKPNLTWEYVGSPSDQVIEYSVIDGNGTVWGLTETTTLNNGYLAGVEKTVTNSLGVYFEIVESVNFDHTAYSHISTGEFAAQIYPVLASTVEYSGDTGTFTKTTSEELKGEVSVEYTGTWALGNGDVLTNVDVTMQRSDDSLQASGTATLNSKTIDIQSAMMSNFFNAESYNIIESISVVSATAENGTVVINVDGTLNYTPNTDHELSDSIEYVIRDQDGKEDTGIVQISLIYAEIDDIGDEPINPIATDGTVFDGTEDGDTLTGTQKADVFYGKGGSDTITLKTDGVWSARYEAQNMDLLTQTVNLEGKNKFTDVIDGGASADTLVLTNGNDAFFVDDIYSAIHSSITLSSTDKNIESAARIANLEVIEAMAGDDIIDMTSVNYDLSNAISVDAGEGNDVIWGSKHNDSIDGNAGNDVLFGGSGDDSLTGGLGIDTFQFTATAGSDTITDFSVAEDAIELYYQSDDNHANTDLSLSLGILTWSANSNDTVSIDLTATISSSNLADIDQLVTFVEI